MTDLSGKWIEVFKVGDYGDKGKFTTADLDKIAESYDPKLHEAPVVVGHPAHDQPAYGLVKTLRRAGNSLWAQLSKVDPGFSDLVEQGRFTQRSVALYRNMPQTSGPYLRHLAFLGAQPPEVKGLQPIQFNDGERGEHVSIELPPPSAGFKEDEVSNQNPEDTKRTIREVMKEFFAEMFGKKSEPAGATFTEAQVKERIDAAVQKLEAAFQEKLDGLDKEFKERSSTDDDEKAKLKVAAFIERMRAAHRWVPSFHNARLPQTLQYLETGETFTFAEKDAKDVEQQVSFGRAEAAAALTTFLESLPELVPSGELAGQPGRGKVINFREDPKAQYAEGTFDEAERIQALLPELRKEFGEAKPEHELLAIARQRVIQQGAASSISAGKV